jgi:hypothetical protein
VPSTPAYLIRKVDDMHELEGASICIPSMHKQKIIVNNVKTTKDPGVTRVSYSRK